MKFKKGQLWWCMRDKYLVLVVEYVRDIAGIVFFKEKDSDDGETHNPRADTDWADSLSLVETETDLVECLLNLDEPMHPDFVKTCRELGVSL